MSWRTIIVSNKCKLSYKNNYLIIRNEDIQTIHLSEINIIVIDTTEVSITTYLISEIAKRKIKLIFCNEQKNPIGEFVSYYGAHNTSKRVLNQIEWEKNIKDKVWQKIVEYKIKNQAETLKFFDKDNSDMLIRYTKEVQVADKTNREGHAAKVYFNSLFGNEFNRSIESNMNSALDYGYSILLSAFNREVVSKGYITQIGINHRNEFNFFNFSCDLMEIFRPLVDMIVYKNREEVFDKKFKYKLINVLNLQIKIDSREQFVSNAIGIYVNSVINAIEKNDIELILNYEL